MLSTILLMFGEIINSFRQITFNIGGFDISLFTLLVGVFIFATLCRTYLKYVLDLPLNFQSTTNDSYNKFMKQNAIEQTDIWTFTQKRPRGPYELKSKETYYD